MFSLEFQATWFFCHLTLRDEKKRQMKSHDFLVYPGFFFFNYLGGSNLYGNPLQYSCLENPMDGGAW